WAFSTRFTTYYFREDGTRVFIANGVCGFGWNMGSAAAVRAYQRSLSRRTGAVIHYKPWSGSAFLEWRYLGFSMPKIVSRQATPEIRVMSAGAPFWLLLVIVAAPTVLLWHRDQRHRFAPGHCQNCGYNLTGNETGKCPECSAPCISSTR